MNFRRQVLTVPNAITISRLGLLIPVCRDIIADAGRPRTFVLTGIWALTDWVDGFLARKLDQQSRVGEIIDPIADRFGIGAVAASLTTVGAVPAAVPATIVGTDVVVAVGAGKAALEQRIRVSKLGKLRSFVMFVAFTAMVAERSGFAKLGPIGRAATVIGTGMHVVTGIGYLRDAWVTRPKKRRRKRRK